MTKTIKGLIVLFVVFSVIPFLPEAMNNIFHGTLANIAFTINEPLFGISFRFVKDVIMFILLFLFFVKDLFGKTNIKRSGFFMFYFPITALIVYGTSVMIYESITIDYLQITAGFRLIALFIVCYKSLFYLNNKKFFSRLSKVISFLVVLEFLIISLQYYDLGKNIGFGNPFSHRLIGTFGGFAMSGYFAVSCSCLFFINRNFKYGKILQLMCLAISSLSGTRAAMIGCAIVILASVLRRVIGVKISKRTQYLMVSLCCFGLIGLVPLVQFVSNVSARGNILNSQVNGGRINLIVDYINNNPLTSVLFGKGIGFGTNAAVNLSSAYNTSVSGAVIMDGTINTIITQYGIAGLTIFLFLFARFVIVLFKKSAGRNLEVITLIASTAVIGISTDIFEQYPFCFITFVSCFLLMNEGLASKEGKKSKQHKIPRNPNGNEILAS